MEKIRIMGKWEKIRIIGNGKDKRNGEMGVKHIGKCENGREKEIGENER